MKKMDIRTKFTQTALKNSLIELMKTTHIRDIPIKAICAGADVSRSTFYTYYDDQYDLLEAIQNETFGNFEARYGKYLGQPSLPDAKTNIEELLGYIIDNNDSIQVLLGENGDANFQKKFFEDRIKNARKMIKNTSADSIDENLERLYSVFLVRGCMALLQDWMKHGFDVPTHKIVKMQSKLMGQILR